MEYTILGVTKGVYYGQNERVDELNSRIASRHFPDSPLEPNFSLRPVPTKYSHFPIIDRRKQMNEPIVPYLDYNSEINFNPGSSRAPISGYTNKVDIETQLRNQYFALQHGADQSVYVPSSNSDLYKINVNAGEEKEQPYPLLFEHQRFNNAIHPNVNNKIGNDRFFNHTRTQMRDM